MSTGYHCFVDVDVRPCHELKKQREVCNLHEVARTEFKLQPRLHLPYQPH
jgi:hypothetical protein